MTVDAIARPAPDVAAIRAIERIERSLTASHQATSRRPAPESQPRLERVADGYLIYVGDIVCELSWHGQVGPLRERPGSESSIQAMCGLMHGQRASDGRPRRMGLDVTSGVAGLLAAQGVLACMVGRSRGISTPDAGTSVLQAGLLVVGHHFANATCDDDSWSPPEEPAGSVGPPFPTADGHWIELETFSLDDWTAFWLELDVHRTAVAKAWNAFRRRYASGVCALPEALHTASRARPLSQLAELADRTRISLCRVRDHDELLREGSQLDGFSTVAPLPVTTAAAGSAARRRGLSRTTPLPLHGIQLVESTNRFAGPLVGQLLRMLGADVTRIEPPGGDPYRLMAPATLEGGATFLHFNRDKTAVELNLGSPAGRSELLDLVTDADIFLHNWRPGRDEQWQLTPHHLGSASPSLVCASLTGWHADSDMDHVLGTDFLVQAHTGLGAGINPVDEPPFPSRLTLSDYLGALVTCEGVLRALYERELTGQGRQVMGSLTAGAAALQSPVLRQAAGPDRPAHLNPPPANGRPMWSEIDRPLAVADGWLSVSIATHRDLSAVAHVLGLSLAELAQVDARLLARRLAGAKAADTAGALAEVGVPAAAVCTELASLPFDLGLAPLFDLLPGNVHSPASPWTFRSEEESG